MQWNQCNWWVRQTHRWLSVTFTLAVIANGITVLRGKYNAKLGLVAVAFIFSLLFTGLCLFALPYAAKWRNRHNPTP